MTKIGKRFQSGMSLPELCVASVVLSVAVIGLIFYWHNASVEAGFQQVRTLLEQDWQRLLLLLKQDLRSTRKARLENNELVLQTGIFNRDESLIELATITWRIDETKSVRREIAQGKAVTFFSQHFEQPMRFDLDFVLKNDLVEVSIQAFKIGDSSPVYRSLEIIALPGSGGRRDQ